MIQETKEGHYRITLYSLYFVLFEIYYILYFLSTTTLQITQHSLYSISFGIIENIIIIISLCIIGKQYIEVAKKDEVKTKALIIFLLKLSAIIIFALIRNNYTHNRGTCLLAILSITFTGQEEEKTLKWGFNIGAFLVVLCFFLSMLGFIDNNRGNSFGFIYRTHYACHLLCLALAYCLWRDGKLSWKGELGLVLLFVYNALFVGGKTLFGCLLILMLGTFWRHYRKAQGVPYQDRAAYGNVIPILFRILYLPVVLIESVLRRFRNGKNGMKARRVMIFSFVIIGAFFILATASYRIMKPMWDRVPGIGSVKSRLVLGVIGFEEFPLRMLGNNIPQWGLSASEDIVDFYYALDSGYIKLLLQFGWLLFLAVIGLMTWAQFRLYRARRYYAMFLLSVFAIDGMMDYWMISLAYNLFILLATCRLQPTGDWPTAEEGLLTQPGKRMRRGIAAALCLALFGWWCATAYPISTWRGWTPASHATVVLPGDFIEGISNDQTRLLKIDRTRQYLEAHDDARCILSGTAAETAAMKGRLLEAGIAPERLTVNDGVTNVEDMLTAATETIDRDGLPTRLTVCAFTMQQARIAKTAKRLKLPVNSLTVEMPKLLYLPNYLLEQWKIML